MKKLIPLLLILSFTFACGGGGGGGTRKAVVYPNQITPEAQAKFDEIEQHYRRKNYDYAFSGYDFFIQTFPGTKLTDEARYKQAKIVFLNRRFDDAAARFATLASKSPSPIYKAKGHHFSGYSWYLAGDYQKSLDQLQQANPEELSAKVRVQMYSLRYRSAKEVGADEASLLALLQLYDTYEGYAGDALKSIVGAQVVSYTQAGQLIDAWVMAPSSVNDLPSWIKKYPPSPSRPFVEYKVARAYHQDGDNKKAQKFLSYFVSKYPKHKYQMQAQKLLTDLGGEIPTEVLGKAKFKVGVLVPLTGRYQKHGQEILDGVKCAVGFEGLCGEFSGIQLIVKESGFTPFQVRQAVDELVSQGVVAIIGPLSSGLSIEAGIVATEKGVPIFPFTQKTGLMAQGGFIFQVGLQPQQQIEALVQAALNKGHKSFGVFYPDTDYGKRMAELFEEEVHKQNAKITAKASYRKRAPDPYAQVRKLKDSLGRLDPMSGGLGFDALFIPDSYTSINALVGALEFNGIRGVPLLGTTAWNDPSLKPEISEKFPGSFFVDLYDGTSNRSDVKGFREKFMQSFARYPRVLEAYGYDVMMIIRSMALKYNSRKIADALNSREGHNGVTGIRGFIPGESALVETSVVDVKDLAK